jgi:hypothetical protein
MPKNKRGIVSDRSRPTTTNQNVVVYETCAPLLAAMLKEIRELAKKKPDAVMSKANVGRVNRLLTDLRGCLNGEDTSKYLDLLDEETLPQYSDALIIMSQFEAALEAFRTRYYLKSDTDELGFEENWEWSVS